MLPVIKMTAALPPDVRKSLAFPLHFNQSTRGSASPKVKGQIYRRQSFSAHLSGRAATLAI